MPEFTINQADGFAVADEFPVQQRPTRHSTTMVVWTLTAIRDGAVLCSVHHNLEQAYREAVAQVQYCEGLDIDSAKILEEALRQSLTYRNWHFLHKCLQSVTQRLSAIQIDLHHLRLHHSDGQEFSARPVPAAFPKADNDRASL